MGAVAPGQAGTTLRRTTVKRRPHWMEWGNDGKGDVVLLPADRTHNVQLVDSEGIQEPYYQSKGFVPLNLLPKDHKAHGMFADLCKAAVARAKSDRMPVPDWVPPSMSGG